MGGFEDKREWIWGIFGETCISAPSGLSAAAAVAVSAGTVLAASASTPTVLVLLVLTQMPIIGNPTLGFGI